MRKLTSKFVTSVSKAGKYSDSQVPGFFLLVKDTGRKSYGQRITIQGTKKVRELGLGNTDLITLAEVRIKAQENRKMAFQGIDPYAEKNRVKVPTFVQAAKDTLQNNGCDWTAKHKRNWFSSLERHIFPVIGNLLVPDIELPDIEKALKPLWHKQPQLAGKLQQRINQVMLRVVALKYRTDNPASIDLVKAVLGKRKHITVHHKALPYSEVQTAIETIQGALAHPAIILCLQFAIFTAARSGEARGAVWSEINLDAATWTIPAKRMKTGIEHRVPLSDSALKVLQVAREIYPDSNLVFPSKRGRVLRPAALSDFLLSLGIQAVPHGFRSSFRQWAAERTNIPREVCELALSHVNKNRVEARLSAFGFI